MVYTLTLRGIILPTAVALALITFAPAAIAANSSTHLNVPSEDLVTLVDLGDGFGRVRADGRIERPFEIPARSVLIITDAEWLAPNCGPGGEVEFRLQIDNDDDNVLVFIATGLANPSGIAQLHKRFASGITVGPSRFRPNVRLEARASSLDAIGICSAQVVILRGYLTGRK